MKKLAFLFCFFISFYSFAQSYHINNVEYNLEKNGSFSFGTTKIYALEQHVSVDTKSIFESEEDFQTYLTKYVKELNNTRAFENIEVTYNLIEELSTKDVFEVTLFVYLKDSFHLIALPHVIGYNSNDGWKPKLKAKDSNFLGSLNTMSCDFYSIVPLSSDNKNYEIGAEFDFDLPFKCSIFDCLWINDYCFSYNFGQNNPEWDAQTGLRLILPLEKIKLQFEFNQYSYRNYDYALYDDSTYFKEEANFSVPLELFTIENWATFNYQPYASVYYNWDKNGINIQNTDLSSPTVSIGHQFYSNNICWYENYRKGISFTLNNQYLYYFQRKDFIPFVSLTADFLSFFDYSDSAWFSKIGMNAHFYSFFYFSPLKSEYFYGTKIGSYLRGIRDDQAALNTSSAFIANFDLPFHIFRTSFNSKLMNYFNCDMQISPFIDFALYKNSFTNNTFSLKDGFYAGGFECLVYPKKWSSFTVRASVGFDLGRMLFPSLINMDWRQDVATYELSLGLGLHY